MTEAIAAKRSRIAILEQAIQDETDFGKRQELEAEKGQQISDVADLENRIKIGRVRFGESYELQINVD